MTPNEVRATGAVSVPLQNMTILFFVLLLTMLLIGCSSLNRMEQSHYDLYATKALFCTSFQDGRAVFSNPQNTRKYICPDRRLSNHWSVGDTLILDEHIPRSQVYRNLEYNTFWSLKTFKK